MEHNDKRLQQAMAFARSPAGQELMRILRQTGSPESQAALEKAASGDYSRMGLVLSELMANPRSRDLLRQMMESNGR